MPNVAPEHLTARMVVENPEAYLKNFVSHWERALPDLTDVPNFDPEQLSFWLRHHKQKTKKKPRKLKKPHRLLPGVCAKWLNLGIDFAIKNNKWPVKMVVVKEGENLEIDLTDKFILVVWCYYTANMCTRPALTSNACQKVLAYFLTNTQKIVKTWRHRMYSYSSGTIMLDVKQPIVDWIQTDDSPQREIALRRLDNSSNELYPLVSSFICNPSIYFYLLFSFALCLFLRCPRLSCSL